MIEWVYNTALTSGQTKIVPIGAEASGENIADCRHFTYLTWGFISSHNARIYVHGSNTLSFAVADELLQYNITGTNYSTPYNLTAPLNNTGVFVLTRPFIRLTIEDQATANHTYTRFYARSW